MEKKLTLSVQEASKIIGRNPQFIYNGLQQGRLPWGHAVMMEKEWSYIIYKKKLEEYVGRVGDDGED